MSIHLISSAQAKQLMSMKDCIDVMEDVLISLENGTAHMPFRTIMDLPGDRGVLGMMPSYIENAQVMG